MVIIPHVNDVKQAHTADKSTPMEPTRGDNFESTGVTSVLLVKSQPKVQIIFLFANVFDYRYRNPGWTAPQVRTPEDTPKRAPGFDWVKLPTEYPTVSRTKHHFINGVIKTSP
jgi:hypothetical protein